MRTTSTTLALFALLAAGAQAPPLPPPPLLSLGITEEIPRTGDALIEGLVRRQDTGEPLAAVEVVLTLYPRTGAPSLRSSLTDSAGRFVFERLPAEAYTLRISSENFFAPPVGGSSAAVLTEEITLGGGQRRTNLAYNLVPAGVIHGLIRDDAGRPTPDISVTALRVTYVYGRKTLENAKSVQSDDRGEFRLFGLRPGEYYVRADGTVNSNPVVGYYPAGSEIESAIVVRVRGGDESSANMRILQPNFIHRIH
jgi:hypothetical protein